MSNWSKTLGGALTMTSGSAPSIIPSGYVALYTSGSDGSVYYQSPDSTPVKIG